MIWAFATINPDSSSPTALIEQHLSSGTLTLDLTKPLTSSTSLSNPAGGASMNGTGSRISIPFLPYQKMIIAHAVLAAVGFLILLPAGSLFARYVRTFSSSWFKAHWIIQFAVACPLIFIGVLLGVGSVHSEGVPHLNDAHKVSTVCMRLSKWRFTHN